MLDKSTGIMRFLLLHNVYYPQLV